jgi:hypothetical protein
LETWADAELAFGSLTKKFTLDQALVLRDCYDDFLSHLSEYLLMQERNSIVLNKDNTIKHFSHAITNFQSFLRPQQSSAINTLFNKHSHENFRYNFINFNYTRCFDNCLKLLGQKGTKISEHKYQNKTLTNTLGDIVHVHGTVEQGMIMGVNDESQIENKEILEARKFKRTIIKPLANDNSQYGLIQQSTPLVGASSIICIFGMSLGKTDNFWWAKIGEALRSNPERQLVIFLRRDAYNNSIISHFLDAEEDAENLFFENANVPSGSQDALRNRIHVVINADLFGGKNILQN